MARLVQIPRSSDEIPEVESEEEDDLFATLCIGNRGNEQEHDFMLGDRPYSKANCLSQAVPVPSAAHPHATPTRNTHTTLLATLPIK
ncbi:MAG: hypothetical protein Q9216_002275 [Gyalolechia sp. 2 TL-2023]